MIHEIYNQNVEDLHYVCEMPHRNYGIKYTNLIEAFPQQSKLKIVNHKNAVVICRKNILTYSATHRLVQRTRMSKNIDSF